MVSGSRSGNIVMYAGGIAVAIVGSVASHSSVVDSLNDILGPQQQPAIHYVPQEAFSRSVPNTADAQRRTMDKPVPAATSYSENMEVERVEFFKWPTQSVNDYTSDRVFNTSFCLSDAFVGFKIHFRHPASGSLVNYPYTIRVKDANGAILDSFANSGRVEPAWQTSWLIPGQCYALGNLQIARNDGKSLFVQVLIDDRLAGSASFVVRSCDQSETLIVDRSKPIERPSVSHIGNSALAPRESENETFIDISDPDREEFIDIAASPKEEFVDIDEIEVDCERGNTGSYTFVNQSANRVKCVFIPSSKLEKTLVLSPGERVTLYAVRAGTYSYRQFQSRTSGADDWRFISQNSILVTRCGQGTRAIQ